MNNKLNIVQLSDFKANIARAFAALRREGFIARRNFKDCQACAWAAVTEQYGSPDNVVFYTQQDDASMASDGSTFLSWRGNAQKIVEALEAVGLTVKWDRSEDQRILVSPKKIRPPKNQIMEIRFVAWMSTLSQGTYDLTITRKDGSKRSYSTKHLSSKAFDILSWCADDPRWLERMHNSLSIYPMLTYYFRDRTNEQ